MSQYSFAAFRYASYFTISYSPSDRANCLKCHQNIGKNQIRVGWQQCDVSGTYYTHLSCFKVMPKDCHEIHEGFLENIKPYDRNRVLNKFYSASIERYRKDGGHERQLQALIEKKQKILDEEKIKREAKKAQKELEEKQNPKKQQPVQQQQDTLKRRSTRSATKKQEDLEEITKKIKK